MVCGEYDMELVGLKWYVVQVQVNTIQTKVDKIQHKMKILAQIMKSDIVAIEQH